MSFLLLGKYSTTHHMTYQQSHKYAWKLNPCKPKTSVKISQYFPYRQEYRKEGRKRFVFLKNTFCTLKSTLSNGKYSTNQFSFINRSFLHFTRKGLCIQSLPTAMFVFKRHLFLCLVSLKLKKSCQKPILFKLDRKRKISVGG